jgi:hypothetical protein
MSEPIPIAGPSTAATVGTGSETSVRMMPWNEAVLIAARAERALTGHDDAAHVVGR